MILGYAGGPKVIVRVLKREAEGYRKETRCDDENRVQREGERKREGESFEMLLLALKVEEGL